MSARLEEIKDALSRLDEQRVLELVRASLAGGDSPLAIVEACEESMRIVGGLYERQEYFLSALIMAGEIFRQVLELTGPGLEHELAGTGSGTVVLGTVAGDIHDIGKNVVALALRAFGFTVSDLGVNVPPDRFWAEVRGQRPQILGLSGLVSPAYESMQKTVQLLRDHAKELERPPFIIIGGGTLDEDVARYIDPDAWTTDAMEGVRICQRVMEGQ
jgi:dimethylamine corrinoid protein